LTRGWMVGISLGSLTEVPLGHVTTEVVSQLHEILLSKIASLGLIYKSLAPIETSAFNYNLRRCISPAEERRINFGPPPLMLDLQELPLNFPRMVMGNSVTMLPALVSASISKPPA
jgi:hypothetical protein